MIDTKIYNPAGQPKQWLIEHFVVRTKVFEKIFKDIQEGKMKYPEQHYLIQGQRGMGKTTLLLRLKYEIENTPKLNIWLVPVFFNEESYDLTSLSNLWEKLLKYLDDLWQTNGSYYKKTDEFVGKTDYEKKCFDYLLEILKTEKKKLVIFFDNFGQLFLDNLKEKEQHRLREILMNCADIRIIGASAVVINDLHDYSKPFFEFFKIINLEGLNKDETLQLVSKLQEKTEHKIDLKKNTAKIDTLAILTGGVIRTVMLIYEVIFADEDGTALRNLEAILDKITPLYKDRIEDLPVQQRKIIDVIAKKWDAISTKEISASIRENGQPMATKLISAQLQQLEKNNVIEKKQTNTKNHLYQLKERFFNIWYLMRNGDRIDKCRVIWLTKYLEFWYDDAKGFESFLKEHIKHLQTGKYHSGSALIISEALSGSDKLDIMSKDLLLKETSTILNDEEKKLLPDITQQKIDKAFHFNNEEKYEESIKLLNTIDKKTNKVALVLGLTYSKIGKIKDVYESIKGIKPADDSERYMLGLLHYIAQHYNESINLLKEYKGEHERMAIFFIGEMYYHLENYKEAITYCMQSIKLKDYEAYGSLIKSLQLVNDFEGAEKYCLEAISNGVKEMKIELVEIYMRSSSNEKLKKATQFIKQGLTENPEDPDFNYLNGIYFGLKGNSKMAEKFQLKAHTIYLKKNIISEPYYTNLYMLLGLLIELKQDKVMAKKILNSIKHQDEDLDLSLYSSYILIWENKYKEGFEKLMKYLESVYLTETKYEFDLLNNIILLLLAKKQYHSALKLFEMDNLNLKDRFKPVYYALMHYLKDEFPNEYLKMGEELKQPVDDIMSRIKTMAVEYT